MSKEQSKKTTRKTTAKPRKRVSRPKSKGLGDDIEKITKATGIKKVVDKVSDALGVDCGCEKRKDWLNKRFRYRDVECLTKEQADRWNGRTFKGHTLTHSQRMFVAEFHAEVFKHPLQTPCTCSPAEWKRMINDCTEMYDAYIADNE